MSVSLSVCPFLCPAAALQQHRGHRTFPPCCRRTDTLLALFLYTKLRRLPHISVGLSVVEKEQRGPRDKCSIYEVPRRLRPILSFCHVINAEIPTDDDSTSHFEIRTCRPMPCHSCTILPPGSKWGYAALRHKLHD